MVKKNWTEEKLIAAIKHSPEERNEAMRFLVEEMGLYFIVKAEVLSGGGDEADAKDLFQECVLVLYHAILDGAFRGDSKLSTYFTTVARRSWWRMKSRNNRERAFEPAKSGIPGLEEAPDAAIIEGEERLALRRAISQMSQRCQQLLGQWMHGLSPDRIAEQMGFSSGHLAKKETYRCRKRLRRLLDENPGLKARVRPG